MKTKILPFILFFSFLSSEAQVGIGTTTPHHSAALDITDSTRGMLVPRMTMLKRNAIVNPAQGLLVYQTDSTKGFWYFEGTSWKNINASPNYGGKHTIVLSDTITNSQAVTKIATEFGPNTQQLIIEGCQFLTTIDLSMFTTAIGITISDNPLLQAVNLANLKTCEGYFTLNNCPALNNVNISSLERILYAGSFATIYINNVGLANLNFPKLKRVLGDVSISNSTYLKTISFPVLLQNIGFLDISDNAALLTISFPLLQSMPLMTCARNGSLTGLSFPSLTSITYGVPNYECAFLNCGALTSLVLGNLALYKPTGFETQNTRLSSESVNALLHNFASITPPVTGKIIRLPQTPAAPPTGQGLIDKVTLIANGNTVTTD